MNRLLLFLILILSGPLSWAQVHVRGYYRKDGTYVRPHERTRPNNTVTDNYSYPGNYNPNTGKITGGSVYNSRSELPEPSPRPSYSATTTTYSEPVPIKPVASSNSISNSTLPSKYLYAEVEPNAALRKDPSYLANSTYAIPKGSLVKIVKYDENYYQAEVNGHTGYVCTCQVKKTFVNP
ncbi:MULTISPECIES: hypothetical protein [unclassified Spirosoma]|uniref:hypothetical protein n=1 Tax=unclassified Spirosoma TaxID=2621999 RepID=UPI000959E695|nr:MULTISPECIES: hypothetical protein [unclassified Spirosoma]MBN8825487.1 hypothetical protein [Spirosoma sp.]OJW74258.1 MAG: hypothetical protein BGO59_14180 [Spirosoma sp. 48-14]